MKRKTGVTVLAVLLFILSFAGFGNSYVNFTHPILWSPFLGASAFLYGVSALIASIGLWLNRSWGYVAFVIFSLVVVAGLIAIQFSFLRISWLEWVVALLLHATIMLLLIRYVRKSIVLAL
jgi:hypothetical protein